MIPEIYTGSAAKGIDRLAIEQFGYLGFDLMTLAGETAFDHINSNFQQAGTMLVLCGRGNNGGDGYIVAAAALEYGWNVTLVATGQPKSDDAQRAAQRFYDAGGVGTDPRAISDDDRYDVIIDGLLGVGVSGEPHGLAADLIECANRLSGRKIAIDVPSGVDADTGAAFAPCFAADETITFIVPKIGVMTGPAASYVGQLFLQDLGVSNQVRSQFAPCAHRLEKPSPKQRRRDSHKGHFGHVVIAGGDNGMLGAVLLAGRAALRSGSGKVHVLSTDQHLDQPALFCPELMSAVFEPENFELVMQADAIAVGPGLGTSAWGRSVFDALLSLENPMVIDADGLNLLASTDSIFVNTNQVLTPHPGEAARLLNWATAEVQRDRREAALLIARQRNAVCVLKGAGTLIASPEGDVFVCDRGNPGMATAGMGDVLTGMIAAQLGLGLPPLEAAKAAVWLHAVAADCCIAEQSQSSLVASDVIEQLCFTD